MDGEYGLDDGVQRTCYLPADLPGTDVLFGDPESGEYVAECPIAPETYFGDRLLK